jgi:hypothetical protein
MADVDVDDEYDEHEEDEDKIEVDHTALENERNLGNNYWE